MYQFGDFELDIARGQLQTEQREIELRPKSFEVLRYLVENPGRLISKDELIKAVWQNVIVTDESLTQCVSEVRLAIGDREQTKIRTVPRRGYRFAVPVSLRETTASQYAGSESNGGRIQEQPMPDRPSIAVLPLVNLSGDPEQEYFGDGVTEDIITELSRFSELVVIARTSTFQYKGKAVDIRQVGRELGVRYVLEGSIRRAGNRVRVAVQLIDTTTGAHRWAERYDREQTDDFALQDDVARDIVTILASYVKGAETERRLLKPPATWEAYDYYLRGAEVFRLAFARLDRDLMYEARRLLLQSLAVDPSYARAYALLARTHTITYLESVDDDYLSAAALDRAQQLAMQAVQLDANLPEGHSQLGWVLLWLGRHAAALAEFERAIVLNPNYNDHSYGHCLIFAGEPGRALEAVRSNMRVDPFQFRRLAVMGHAHYTLGSYKDAIPPLRECASYIPNVRVVHLWLAAAYAQLELLAEARSEAAEVLRIEPDFNIGKWKCSAVYRTPDHAEHLFDGLRKAGLTQE
jgi:adenylate cyclase